MKKLLFCLFFTPIFSFSQEPPKGSNVILISPATFQEISVLLLDKGYTFSNKDTSDKILLTEFRTETKSKMNYRIRARIKDSTLFLSAQFRLGMEFKFGGVSNDPQELQDAQYKGWKTGAYRIIFEKIQDIATMLNGKISYSKL